MLEIFAAVKYEGLGGNSEGMNSNENVTSTLKLLTNISPTSF